MSNVGTVLNVLRSQQTHTLHQLDSALQPCRVVEAASSNDKTETNNAAQTRSHFSGSNIVKHFHLGVDARVRQKQSLNGGALLLFGALVNFSG